MREMMVGERRSRRSPTRSWGASTGVAECPQPSAADVPGGTVPAVVVGLDSMTGLQTARVLAGHGIPVIGLAEDLRHPCCRTRSCERVLPADVSGPGQVEVLAALGRELGRPAVLFPCTDLSVLHLSRRREELRPWFRLALPEPDVLELLLDKASFYEWAGRLGLPIPATRLLASRAEAELASRELRFPLIVKPAIKTPEWKRSHSRKAYRVATRSELLDLFDRLEWAGTLVVQEWIHGTDGNHYTCNCYFGAGSEPLVTFTSRKLRQWPPGVGEGCLSEECRNDLVEDETVRLFRSAGLHGLGYLEMKRDERSGRYLIVEPNVGRPTGRAACAEAAGVALLLTMYCDVLGLPLPPNRQQRYRGVKWVHLRRDLQSAVVQWRRGQLTAREWARSWRGPKVEALFSWRDPVPFWADLRRVAADHLRGRSGGRQGTAPRP